MINTIYCTILILLTQTVLTHGDNGSISIGILSLIEGFSVLVRLNIP